MVLKLGQFGEKIRSSWEVLERGTEEGLRRSFGPILWAKKKRYKRSRRGNSYIQYEEGRL